MLYRPEAIDRPASSKEIKTALRIFQELKESAEYEEFEAKRLNLPDPPTTRFETALQFLNTIGQFVWPIASLLALSLIGGDRDENPRTLPRSTRTQPAITSTFTPTPTPTRTEVLVFPPGIKAKDTATPTPEVTETVTPTPRASLDLNIVK